MATATATPVAAVAQELVDLVRAGKNREAIDRFYAKDIVSIESVGNEAMPAEMTGIAAVLSKHDWWEENNEVHSLEAAGPFVGKDGFAVRYTFDTTFKPMGRRSTMTEMALYTVKDGKIVREQFFYHVPSA